MQTLAQGEVVARDARQEDAYVLGVDIGGTHLRLALATLDGQIVARTSNLTGNTRHPDHVVALVVEGTLAMLAERSIDRSRLRAAGVGAPGITDVDRGVVIATSYLLGWKDVPLVQLLEQALGVPVTVDNDVNLATLGEGRAGATASLSDFVYIAIGTGIGAGIMLRGELFRGSRWTAGEIGYMLVPGVAESPETPGLPGALERIAGGEGIRIAWRDLCAETHSDYSPELAPTQIFDLAVTGDPLATTLLHRCARPLAYVIHNISLILNIPRVVLGGGVGMHAGLLQAVRDVLSERRYRSMPQVTAAALGTDAQLVGAIHLALEQRSSAPDKPSRSFPEIAPQGAQ